MRKYLFFSRFTDSIRYHLGHLSTRSELRRQMATVYDYRRSASHFTAEGGYVQWMRHKAV